MTDAVEKVTEAFQSAPWMDYALGAVSGKLGEFLYRSAMGGTMVYDNPTAMVTGLKAAPMREMWSYAGGILGFLYAGASTRTTYVHYSGGLIGGAIGYMISQRFF